MKTNGRILDFILPNSMSKLLLKLKPEGCVISCTYENTQFHPSCFFYLNLETIGFLLVDF